MNAYVVTYSYVNKNNTISRGQKVVETADANAAINALTPELNANYKYWSLISCRPFKKEA